MFRIVPVLYLIEKKSLNCDEEMSNEKKCR